MARKAPNINWAFPLEKGRNGFFAFNTTVKDAIKQDIMSLVFTRPTERVVVCDYGTNILNFLFEPKTQTLKIKIAADLKGAIRKFIKGVRVTDVTVLFSEDLVIGSPYYGKVSLADDEVLINISYDVVSRDNLVLNDHVRLVLKIQ